MGTRGLGRTCEVVQKTLNTGHQTNSRWPHTEIPSFQHIIFAVELLCCLLSTHSKILGLFNDPIRSS